jgi:hypothetical protein
MNNSACKWLTAINAINQATEQITGQIEYLRSAGLLKSRVAEIHKMTAEELRAVVCYSAIMRLMDREQHTASQAGKRRRALEKKLSRD